MRAHLSSVFTRLSSWLSARWHCIPAPVRKPLAAVVGVALMLLGLCAIVLPGPFTIPPILLGLALLATEFAFAAKMLGWLRVRSTALLARVRRS